MSQIIPDDMQPIATAPKDGTPVVLWREKYGLYSAQWSNGNWVVLHVGRDGAVKLGNVIPSDGVTLWKPAA